MADNEKIDQIVRLVVSRLRSAESASAHDVRSVAIPEESHSFLPTGNLSETIDELSDSGMLSFSNQVVSIRDIEQRLDGIQRVRLTGNAILTPAARDELLKWNIAIERTRTSPTSSQSELSRSSNFQNPFGIGLIVETARLSLMESLKSEFPLKALAPDASTLDCAGEIALQWLPGQRLVWSSREPFAAMVGLVWHVGRHARSDHSIRPVGLHQSSDLKKAVQESSPNLLILDDKRYSAFQVLRLARSWARILEST